MSLYAAFLLGELTLPAGKVEFFRSSWGVWIGDEFDEFDSKEAAYEDALRRYGVQKD